MNRTSFAVHPPEHAGAYLASAGSTRLFASALSSLILSVRKQSLEAEYHEIAFGHGFLLKTSDIQRLKENTDKDTPP